MSAGIVRAAFRSHLASAITATDVSAPYLEAINNTQPAKDRPAEWCALDFAGADEEPISLRSPDRLFRETGTVFAHAIAAANSGDDTRAVEIADQIRTAFRGANLGNGIVVETVSPPDTGDGKPDGRIFRAIVEIVYRYDFTANA